MKDQLATKLTITRLVNAYLQAETDLRQAFRLLGSVEQSLNDVFMTESTIASRIHVHQRYHHQGMAWNDVEDALTELRRDVWRSLIQRLEIRGMMSEARWNDFHKRVQSADDVPPITMEYVMGFVQDMASQIPTMAEEKVVEVFEWLRPHNSRHKSNSEEEIPPKVVMTWMLDWSDWAPHYRLHWERSQRLIALQSVFQALDGKGHVVKGAYSDVEIAMRLPDFNGAGETDYLRFRCFRNGNMHLAFKRLDLLARLNQIAGGRRLKRYNPAYVTINGKLLTEEITATVDKAAG
jgi:hypothetical protein